RIMGDNRSIDRNRQPCRYPCIGQPSRAASCNWHPRSIQVSRRVGTIRAATNGKRTMIGDGTANNEPAVTRLRFGSERLAKAVYEEIRNRICMLRYPPGHLLHENRLAQEFGISRTPVRQVLQKLEIEGFVETRTGVGTIVTGVDFAAFHDV